MTLAATLAVAAFLALGSGGCTPLVPGTGSSTTRSSGRGVYHTVRKGETLWRISKAYGVGVTEIREANDLTDSTIGIGQRLLIPGARSAKRVTPAPGTRTAERSESVGKPDAELSWPLAGRRRDSVTSHFGPRTDPVYGGTQFHKGIDIDGAREERVLAAADGEIVFAGRMSGFGTVVMVDHGARLITVYAHLSRAIVSVEDIVERGRPVGYIGSTGKATGTHLHFEVRYKGVSVDPLDYLP